MNKQRFLAELRRLLVFMTESDRSIAIERYTAKFDAAGEAGEAALLEKLGSPTKVAISLSRGYIPGQITAEAKQRDALKKAEKKAREVKNVPLPDYDPLGEAAEDDPVAIIMRSLEESAAEPDEEPEPIDEPDDEYDDEDDDDEYERPHRPEYRRMGAPLPAAAGGTLLGVILLIVGVPLAALTLGVALVWLIPGAAAVIAAGLAAIGALWCLSYIADALLLLALGFLLMALALLLVFCGVWLDVRLIGLYVRGVRALCDALLGRKVAVE